MLMQGGSAADFQLSINVEQVLLHAALAKIGRRAISLLLRPWRASAAICCWISESVSIEMGATTAMGAPDNVPMPILAATIALAQFTCPRRKKAPADRQPGQVSYWGMNVAGLAATIREGTVHDGRTTSTRK
jgi:hypothetical protein